MERFEDLSVNIEPFEPPYTEEFRRYIEESVMKSRLDEARAIASASKIIIK